MIVGNGIVGYLGRVQNVDTTGQILGNHVVDDLSLADVYPPATIGQYGIARDSAAMLEAAHARASIAADG